MTQTIDQPATLHQPTCTDGTCSAPPSGRRFLRAGLGSGLLGSICCIGTALAVGASIGGLSFFATWMERYQIYFVIGSMLIMSWWLVRQARRHIKAGGGVRGFLRSARRQLIVMAAVYAVTLGIATAVVAVVKPM